MTDRGVLQLLHGASHAYSSARASVRVWRDEALNREARQRAVERDGRGRNLWISKHASHSGSGDARSGGEWVKHSTVWFVPPSKARCDSRFRWKDKDTTAAHLIDGDRWWSNTPASGFRASSDDRRVAGPGVSRGLGPLLPELDLLDPWELLGDLDLVKVHGGASCTGREALTALANVRELRANHIVRVAPGADQYELTVDAERGVLLRFAALLDGDPFELSEITEIAFDEDIPPEVFRLEEPPEDRRHPRPHYAPSTCSFCGEAKDRLIVGQPAYICDECVAGSSDIAWPAAPPED